jgi:hypothetical protein
MNTAAHCDFLKPAIGGLLLDEEAVFDSLSQEE